MQKYAEALFPTPILNRKDFSYVFGGNKEGILLDKDGLFRSLEMIALQRDVFEVVGKVDENIYQILHPNYPSKSPLYIDGRFVRFPEEKPLYKKPEMPKASVIVERLQAMLNLPYVWGGNYSKGIAEMAKFYPLPKDISLTEKQKANWFFQGVDCSGMLFEATLGLTPRNTSWMKNMGRCIQVQGMPIEKIKKLMQPLDAILWHTHVLFVLDDFFTIESRAKQGVVFKTPILERLEQIFQEEKKEPRNNANAPDFLEKGFVLIRWHPEYI